ncbi:adiponectin receptor protein-like [Oppia nitens]|uniref:adiponectin receptor protein-like n=1 Tax=Oppia nitens TaxID=1686743 RepID=UPI0023D9A276|nr:adiponectin receptor protein-like [Oppia nitens]
MDNQEVMSATSETTDKPTATTTITSAKDSPSLPVTSVATATAAAGVTLSSPSLQCQVAEHAEHLAKKFLTEAENVENVMREVLFNAWNVCHFHELPQWLKDNDYLVMGHRPPLSSFKACFWSIFRLHTETGNIWTHGVGCLLFLGLAIHVLCGFNAQYSNIPLMDKMVFGCFFAGAIICLGLSTCYHTLSCHSHSVGRLFSKLDYCGIALLITGSFVPWLYYGFYCSLMPKIFYLCLTIFLGMSSVIVSLWDKFSEPNFRPVRAGVFMSFGLSGVIPGIHWLYSHGLTSWIESSIRASFTSLILMGVLYIIGALLYASRIPERFFPGKCDYWFHSHQLFHIFVILAAVVHYHGITCMADYRLNSPNAVCPVPDEYLEY